MHRLLTASQCVCCVCVFICWVCTLSGCRLHVSRDFVVCNYVGNKTHTSEFTHNDKNRHLNAHIVFEGEGLRLRRLDMCLLHRQCVTYCTYNEYVPKQCVQKYDSQLVWVCCLSRQSLLQETEGSCLWVVVIVQPDYPPSSPLLHHTHSYTKHRPHVTIWLLSKDALISCLTLNTFSRHSF